MANTNSWRFPDIFNVTQNTVSLVSDERSITNRGRLLMLTEPTELYNSPEFGVGLKRYIWQYNTENVRAMMKDRIKDQFALNEPCVYAQDITFVDKDATFADTEHISPSQDYHKVHMDVKLPTTFGGNANIFLDDEITMWFDEETHTDTDELALR